MIKKVCHVHSKYLKYCFCFELVIKNSNNCMFALLDTSDKIICDKSKFGKKYRVIKSTENDTSLSGNSAIY